MRNITASMTGETNRQICIGAADHIASVSAVFPYMLDDARQILCMQKTPMRMRRDRNWVPPYPPPRL